MERTGPKTVDHGRPALGYGPLPAILVTVGSYFASEILVGLVLGVLQVILSWDSSDLNAWLDRSVMAQFLSVVLISAAMLGLIGIFLRSRKTKWTALGLRWPVARDFGYGAAGYLVYFVLSIIALQLAAQFLPGLRLEQEQEILFDKQTTGSALWIVYVSLVILPPLVEEIIFRGFLYGGLRTKWPKAAAAVATSILFAAAHLQVGSGNALLWVAALDTFMLSMILVYVRERTGALVAPMFIHFIKNSLAFLFLFVLRLGL